MALKNYNSRTNRDLTKKYHNSIGFETKLWFGKYSGKNVNEIIKKDKNYIKWLIKNTLIPFDKSLLDYMNKST